MLTPYQTQIPVDQIEQGELTDLVNRLAAALGDTAEVSQVYVVSTESLELSEIIDNVAYGIDQRKTPKAKAEDRIRKPRGKGDGHPRPNAGAKSYTNIKTSERLSKQVINKMLAAGELVDGVTFLSFKGDRWVVMDGKMVKEPQA